jgi:inosine-uridine nucleoside N-ribohydrolase
VLDSGVPVTLVPLDATNDAPLALDFVERLAADSETPQAKFAAQVMDNLREVIGFGYYFWDPLAAAVLVDESLTTFASADLTVVTDEGPESGRIVPAGDGVLARYATSADLERLETFLIDTLNGRTD